MSKCIHSSTANLAGLTCIDCGAPLAVCTFCEGEAPIDACGFLRMHFDATENTKRVCFGTGSIGRQPDGSLT